MRIPLERLIDGAVQALTEHVAPQVPDRFARGQLWSVIDILNNLRERIDWKSAPLDEEARAAADVLADLGRQLRAAGHGDLAARLPELAADGTATERVTAARAALVTAMEVLAGAPAAVAAPLQASINTLLLLNAVRDLQIFKPSLLQEISKG
jgi:hypothetical protein